MDLNKVAVRFKRAWVNAGRALNVKLPDVVSVTQSRFPDEYDVSVVFDQHVTAYVDTFTEIGCVVDRLEYNVADLKLPAEWLAARERIASNPDITLSSFGKLHNALLDAGIADWLEIQLTPDQTALEVEFLDHPTAEQIAALKVGYDVLTFEELTYTFVERTGGQAAPLVDPAKVEAKVRQCWAGGHGGKIAALEAQADPREWIVTTVKPVPANANLRNHGLALVKQIAPEVSHVRVMDELWAKLLQKPAAATDTTEAATVADGDTQPIPEPEPTPKAAPLPELDDRDVELNALRVQVEELQGILRALTPVTDEWQTLKLTLPKDGKVTAHPEIAAEQAKGWKIHHVQYAPNGEDRLFVFMERRAVPQYQTVRYATANHYAGDFSGTWKGSANGYVPEPTQIIISNGARSLKDSMIDAMNDEIAPSMNALASAFGVDPAAWR